MDEENDKLIYEVGFHLLPTIDEVSVPSETLGIKSIIEDNKGVVISEDMPKLIPLAYDISKSIDSKKHRFNKAYFGWVKFEIEASKIGDIKSKIENLQNVLRFLIVRTVRENTMHIPKIPMFKKENIKEEKTEEGEIEKPKATEAEIDKSIDELIIEN